MRMSLEINDLHLLVNIKDKYVKLTVYIHNDNTRHIVKKE